MRSDRERLLDILDAAERVAAIVRFGRGEFDASDIVQDALIRRLEIIGEAAGRLSEGIRRAHPTVPWRQITSMRNRTAHGYFDVDRDLLWEVAYNDVPQLARQVAAVLDTMPQQ